jgi:hypothetical protein
MCIMHSVPMGAMGVTSNEYIPSIASYAESFGLVVHGRSMLSVMFICSRSLHQLESRYIGGAPARMATK